MLTVINLYLIQYFATAQVLVGKYTEVGPGQNIIDETFLSYHDQGFPIPLDKYYRRNSVINLLEVKMCILQEIKKKIDTTTKFTHFRCMH